MDPEEGEEGQEAMVGREDSSEDSYSGTRLQGSDLIRTLQLLELSVKPAYLLACYASLAESYDWKRNTCECLPEEIILNSHSSFRDGEREKLRHWTLLRFLRDSYHIKRSEKKVCKTGPGRSGKQE